ncbi:SAM-dependent methyltransferase [Teichococcus aestuarii]|uniref:SAM-dependent methyltransferase n=1 Tax=Teichococcus aestuarii TaxID=568898 RepID=UPI00360D7A62
MTHPTGSLPAAYFEALYAADPDPWRFRDSAYEAGKYAATLAALERPRYGRVLEVGCSIGVLTKQLAGRCDRCWRSTARPAPSRRRGAIAGLCPASPWRSARCRGSGRAPATT